MIKPISFYYGNASPTWQGAWKIVLLLCITGALYAGPAYDQGIEAFQFNRLDEAALFFEQAIEQERPAAPAYQYLGLCYEKLGRVEDAVLVFRRALDQEVGTPADRARIALQLGISLSRANRYEESVAAYDRALSLDNSLAAVYLNRANSNVARKEYGRSIADYRLYLSLKPSSDQKPQIEQMIVLLTETVEAQRIAAAEAEQQRVAAEEAAREAAAIEQARIDEERRAAEQLRQNMLDSVLQSLSTAGRDTHSYETESEDISDYNEDFDILE